MYDKVDYLNNSFLRRNRYTYKEGDWKCPNKNCSNPNFAKRVICNLCGAKKPEIIEEPTIQDYHFSRLNKANHHSSLPSKHSLPPVHHSSNHIQNNINSNPNHANQGLFKEGDWRCTKCFNVNFKWRRFCNRCTEPYNEGMPSTSMRNNSFGFDGNNRDYNRDYDRDRGYNRTRDFRDIRDFRERDFNNGFGYNYGNNNSGHSFIGFGGSNHSTNPYLNNSYNYHGFNKAGLNNYNHGYNDRVHGYYNNNINDNMNDYNRRRNKYYRRSDSSDLSRRRRFKHYSRSRSHSNDINNKKRLLRDSSKEIKDRKARRRSISSSTGRKRSISIDKSNSSYKEKQRRNDNMINSKGYFNYNMNNNSIIPNMNIASMSSVPNSYDLKNIGIYQSNSVNDIGNNTKLNAEMNMANINNVYPNINNNNYYNNSNSKDKSMNYNLINKIGFNSNNNNLNNEIKSNSSKGDNSNLGVNNNNNIESNYFMKNNTAIESEIKNGFMMNKVNPPIYNNLIFNDIRGSITSPLSNAVSYNYQIPNNPIVTQIEQGYKKTKDDDESSLFSESGSDADNIEIFDENKLKSNL